MSTHEGWTAPDLDEYRTCIEFDRHVRELAEALVNDLRERLDPDSADDNRTFHADMLMDWIRAVAPRAWVLPDALAPDGDNVLDSYVLRYAVARRWIEPDPNAGDEFGYRLVIP